MSYIPVVDFSDLCSDHVICNDDQVSLRLAIKIREALGSVGFMQLINHGISPALVESVFYQSSLFFGLDEATKKKYAKPPVKEMSSWYGYTSPGKENAYYDKQAVFEFRETYDWLEGKGIYPDEELPQFNPLLNELHEKCKDVAKKVCRLWAIGLGLDDAEYFIKKNQHWINPDKFLGLTNMRVAHYPAIPEDSDIPENSMRIAEHTDVSSLSLVIQDETGGLEVKSGNGWIKVPYIPGALVCNTGDLMEFWTKGLFQATPHRVLIPSSETEKRQPRFSIAYFSGPDVHEVVQPLEIVLTPEEEEKLAKLGKHYSNEPFVALEYTMRKLKSATENTYN